VSRQAIFMPLCNGPDPRLTTSRAYCPIRDPLRIATVYGLPEDMKGDAPILIRGIDPEGRTASPAMEVVAHR